MRWFILGLLLLGAGTLQAQTERTTPATSFGTMVRVADGMTTLQTLIEQPAPATLSKEELAEYQQYTEWLKSVLTRLEVASEVKSPRDMATGQASGRQATTSEVTSPRDMATGQASGKRTYQTIKWNTAMEDVRTAVLAESRKFNTLSNASKARHDIAMNAIRNMKA